MIAYPHHSGIRVGDRWTIYHLSHRDTRPAYHAPWNWARCDKSLWKNDLRALPHEAHLGYASWCRVVL
jgi:hypothetical protein